MERSKSPKLDVHMDEANSISLKSATKESRMATPNSAPNKAETKTCPNDQDEKIETRNWIGFVENQTYTRYVSQAQNSVNEKAIFCKKLLELGSNFYDPVTPADFKQAQLRYWNQNLCHELKLEDDFSSLDAKKNFFCYFHSLPNSLPAPLALRYHGHQFLHYNPDLGDGRGFTFAQVKWKNQLWDFGTKGSGTTPYSRRGDGRLTLKGAFREALATELLESLGVNTSRTFCFFETDESLERNDEPSPTRAAVLTRFSHSHIRIGTFQRLAYLEQKPQLEALLHYSSRHLLTELSPEDETDLLSYKFLKAVTKRLALLSSQWMMAGFIHGVLNTDNLNICGESFDYGPYRFMPEYDPNFVAAYFDHKGLYSYGRQPQMVLWSIQQLATSLKLLSPNLETDFLQNYFSEIFGLAIEKQFLHRLNLRSKTHEENQKLLALFFNHLQTHRLLFEQSFFELFRRKEPAQTLDHLSSETGKELFKILKTFEIESTERSAHPYLKRKNPVTLLINEIEALWAPISEKNDWSHFENKLQEIRSFRGLYDLKTFHHEDEEPSAMTKV